MGLIILPESSFLNPGPTGAITPSSWQNFGAVSGGSGSLAIQSPSSSGGTDWSQFWANYNPLQAGGNFAFPGGSFQDYLGYLEAAPENRLGKFQSWLGEQLSGYTTEPNTKSIGWSGTSATLGELRDWYAAHGGELADVAYNPVASAASAASVAPAATGGSAGLLASLGATSSPTSTSTPQATVSGGSSVDQMLGLGAGDIDLLRQFYSAGGYPIDQLPAWQAMIDAQKANLERGFGNLTEAMNVSGNRFSTAFGDAAQRYWNEAGLNQNALLAQMTLQAQEAARNRQLAAGTALAQLGQSGISQLSSQDFQSLMQQLQQSYGAASSLFGAGTNAASLLAQLGAQGAQGLFNAENQAALTEVQRQLMLQQLGLSGGSDLSNQWLQTLGLGNQLGTSQYNTLNNQLQALYQEWLRTQSEYNPLLQYMYSGATGYPLMYYPSYQPSTLGSTLGGLGSILGGLPAFLQLLGIGG